MNRSNARRSSPVRDCGCAPAFCSTRACLASEVATCSFLGTPRSRPPKTWGQADATILRTMWPGTAAELVGVQRELAGLTPPAWRPAGPRPLVAGCFVCFRRGERGRGWAGEPGWAAAVLMRGDRRQAGSAVVSGTATAPYEPGLLALREGPLLEAAVRALPEPPEVVMANASGRDHPRGAGLALHLGAVLDKPSVGVTDRPLLASGPEPGLERGATCELILDRTEVARAL